MRIRWAESALADLEEIHARQAIDWPSRGAAFDARLSAIEQRLLRFPQSAPEVGDRPGVRVVALVDFPLPPILQPECRDDRSSRNPAHFAAAAV